jgi:hypothetical protein
MQLWSRKRLRPSIAPEVASERLSAVRYDPRQPPRRGLVESYFLKANDPRRRRALWLRATIWAGARAPERAIAEAWAIAFDREHGHVAVKTQVPFEQAKFSRRGLDIEVDGCEMTLARARGRVESGGRSVAYDLAIESCGAPMAQLRHGFMYEGPWPSSKLASPVPDARVTGWVEVDGARWELSRWHAMVGHNWQRRHGYLYGWGHCNQWEGLDEDGGADGLVLEGLSARLAAGPLVLPMATVLCIRYRGVSYDLNGLAQMARNKGGVTPRRWLFQGENDRVTVDGEFWAESDDFVGLHYLNPDDRMTYCLNSKLACARVDLRVKGLARRTFASHAAALEIGTRDAHHGVRMYV